MIVYRLTRKKHAVDLSGKGAALAGARWNSKGTEIIYTSESRALAMAEVSVHLSLDTLPGDFVMLEIAIPDTIEVMTVDPTTLHPDWKQYPPLPTGQLIGDQFIRNNAYCILRVPSAVVKGDHNILINPAHSKFAEIRILSKENFPFDQRFLRH